MKQRKRRGQVFTADFIIAVSILVVGLGALLQSAELSERSAAVRVNTFSSLSDPLAEMIATGKPYLAPTNYCVRYSNGTSYASCNTFSCDYFGGNTFLTQRMVTCTGGTGFCLLRVYTCQ